MYKIVKKEEGTIRKQGDYSITNYLTKEFREAFSLAVLELNGQHELTKSIETDRIYYLIHGNATFIIEEETVKVKEEETLFIEKNTSYSFSGHCKAVLINIPAYGISHNSK